MTACVRPDLVLKALRTLRVAEDVEIVSEILVFVAMYSIHEACRAVITTHVANVVRAMVTHATSAQVLRFGCLALMASCSKSGTDATRKRVAEAGGLDALLSFLRMHVPGCHAHNPACDAESAEHCCIAISCLRPHGEEDAAVFATMLEASDALELLDAMPPEVPRADGDTPSHREGLHSYLRRRAEEVRLAAECEVRATALGRRQQEEAAVAHLLLCIRCGRRLAPAAFSNSQRKKPEASRRCMACVASDAAGVPPAAMALPAPPKIDDQCAVCGAADVKLLRCGRCVELKLASPAGYCSKQCQAAAWPKHKLFHRAARLNDQLTAQAGLNALQTDITLAVTSSSDYLRLCTAAQQRRCESDYRAASKLLKKAIRLEPREPWGYYSLGYTTKGSGAGAEAVPLFVQAASLSEQAPQSDRARFIWVAATTMLFCIWDGPDATGQEYPAWLSDSVAKRSISARCVEITPLRYSAWYMRGRVLLTGVLDVFEPLRTKLCERADGLGDGVVGLVRGAVAGISIPHLREDAEEARRAFEEALRLARELGQEYMVKSTSRQLETATSTLAALDGFSSL